ncbi:MAG TPA: hypothetical protein VMJ10_33735 [Kofleriaceae bacterium]|nr:hypothetical protein [Kofleriaceae bacterium]
MTDRDDDPELAELVRQNRRGAARRLLAVGAVVGLAGAGVMLYGQHLSGQQADSAVQFTLPDRLTLAGGIAAAIGILLVISGAITLVRGRK